MISSENFVERMLQAVPEYKSDYEEDVAEFGIPFDHYTAVFFRNFVLKAYERGDMDILRRVKDFIRECAMSEDAYVREVISLSFFNDNMLATWDDIVAQTNDVKASS